MYQADRVTPSSVVVVASRYSSPRSAGVSAPRRVGGTVVAATDWPKVSRVAAARITIAGSATALTHQRRPLSIMRAPITMSTSPDRSATRPPSATGVSPTFATWGRPIPTPSVSRSRPAADVRAPRPEACRLARGDSSRVMATSASGSAEDGSDHVTRELTVAIAWPTSQRAGAHTTVRRDGCFPNRCALACTSVMIFGRATSQRLSAPAGPVRVEGLCCGA